MLLSRSTRERKYSRLTGHLLEHFDSLGQEEKPSVAVSFNVEDEPVVFFALCKNVRAVGSPVLNVQGIRTASVAFRHSPSANLKVSQNRLMANIHATCEWGKGQP